MSAFEFFFSLFGLILGLAIAVVIGGLSDVLRERTRVPIGWLTPMLATFVLFDLSTLWINAWTDMADIQVAYGSFLAALIVAGIYFFAAGMVFPKTASDWPSLDDYYMSHYRWVIGGAMAANFGVTAIGGVADGTWSGFLGGFARSEVSAIFWITLIVMCVVPRRRVQLAGLAILLLSFLYGLVVMWTPR